MMDGTFLINLLAMALVTYLIRAIPLVTINRKLTNRWLCSFLYYIPCAVMGALIFPAVLFSTGSVLSAALGMVAALIVAFRGAGLVVTAATACVTVLVVELGELYLLPLLV